MNKIVVNVVMSGQDVDMFRGRHTDYIKLSMEEAALKLIQARNHVHGEGGTFKFVAEWQPDGWVEGPTKASEELRAAMKALLKPIQECQEWREVGICKLHLQELVKVVGEYRIKKDIKDAEDEAMAKGEGDAKTS